MRKLLLPAIVVALATQAGRAQISPTGLVAHWRFTGNALDSSGNAHHGTVTAITYTAGRNGLPNTAAVFNTDSSYIAVPYAADLNVVNYSICAIVKPTAFNMGPCQSSVLLERVRDASSPSSGFYNLFYTDNFFDGGNCSAADTSKYIFGSLPGGNTPSAVSGQYTPTIRTNEWTSVVATFNGSVTRMYVNGVLKATLNTPNAIGASLQGLGIGTAPAQPTYDFKGLMDDLRLYNRVLTDSEINIYHNPPVPNAVAGIESKATRVIVTPNPAATSLNIQRDNADAAAFSIVDALGRCVMSGTLSSVESTLNISWLAPGSYFLHTTSKDGANVDRFVKH